MNQLAHIARPGLDRLLLSFLFCLSFGLHATIATELDDLGAFQKFDVLFEANPPDRHEAFSHGSPNEGVTHPMLNLLIAIPIDLLEIAIGWLKGEHDSREFRTTLGLFTLPLISSVGTLLLYRIGGQLGLTRPSRLAVALLGCFSFTNLIFGSIPDHPGLSATLLLLICSIALSYPLPVGLRQRASWLITGVAIAGVTISNLVVVPLFAFLAACGQGTNWRRAACWAVCLCAAVTLLAVGIGKIGNTLAEEPERPRYNISRFANTEPSAVADALVRSARSLGTTLVAPSLHAREDPSAHAFSRIRRQFSLEPVGTRHALLYGGAFLALIAQGAWQLLSAGGLRRSFAAACLISIAFNAVLHGLWGDTEAFLYSPHWSGFALLLAAGSMLPSRKHTGFAQGLFFAVTLLSAVTNLSALRSIETQLLTDRDAAIESEQRECPNGFQAKDRRSALLEYRALSAKPGLAQRIWSGIGDSMSGELQDRLNRRDAREKRRSAMFASSRRARANPDERRSTNSDMREVLQRMLLRQRCDAEPKVESAEQPNG